jgi:hypothetical protein
MTLYRSNSVPAFLRALAEEGTSRQLSLRPREGVVMLGCEDVKEIADLLSKAADSIKWHTNRNAPFSMDEEEMVIENQKWLKKYWALGERLAEMGKSLGKS